VVFPHTTPDDRLVHLYGRAVCTHSAAAGLRRGLPDGRGCSHHLREPRGGGASRGRAHGC